MADVNSSDDKARRRQVLPAKRLAPLIAAAPESTRGRITTLAEARSALRIPSSAEPDVLQAWGTPPDFQLVAFPVADPVEPELAAEFAALIVVQRRDGRLLLGRDDQPLRAQEKSNGLWLLYGSLAIAADGNAVIGTLNLGPAFPEQHSRPGDDVGLGITAELLRLISPTRLLSETVEQLQRSKYWNEVAQRFGLPQPPQGQRQALDRIDCGRPRRGHVPDDQLRALAQRYLVLCTLGLRHPLPQIAQEFGITRTQARDRIHKARQHGYLKPGKQGRTSAQPGPRLQQLGWNQPSPPTG